PVAAGLVGLVCFFSRVAASGRYALMIAGVESRPGLAECHARQGRALGRRAALYAGQFVIPAAIVLGSWSGVSEAGISYAAWWRKADLLFSVFDNYSRPFDVACFALLLMLFGGLAWHRRLHLAPRLQPAVALVLLAY